MVNGFRRAGYWSILLLGVIAVGLRSPPPEPPPEPPVVIVPKDSTARRYASRYNISYSLAVRILAAAQYWEIPVDVAFRLIRMESAFDTLARSTTSTATGLTQILVPTARIYREDVVRCNLYDVELNLDLGFHFLHDMHRKYKSWHKALIAYRHGPVMVDTAISPPRCYADYILRLDKNRN